MSDALKNQLPPRQTLVIPIQTLIPIPIQIPTPTQTLVTMKLMKMLVVLSYLEAVAIQTGKDGDVSKAPDVDTMNTTTSIPITTLHHPATPMEMAKIGRQVLA